MSTLLNIVLLIVVSMFQFVNGYFKAASNDVRPHFISHGKDTYFTEKKFKNVYVTSIVQCLQFCRKDGQCLAVNICSIKNNLDCEFLSLVGSPTMQSTRENCTAISVSTKVSSENQQRCQACKFSKSKNYNWSCYCEHLKPVPIDLVSGSWTGNTPSNSYIKINNEKFMLLNRGHNIIVADLIYYKMHQFRNFDTFGDPTSTSKMGDFIKSVSNGALISVVLHDSGDIFSDHTILSNLLGAKDPRSYYRKSYVLLAVKGEGRLAEFNGARCMECTARIKGVVRWNSDMSTRKVFLTFSPENVGPL